YFLSLSLIPPPTTPLLTYTALFRSGFTRAGDAKAVPLALVERAKKFPLKVNVFTGASLGSDIDRLFAENDLLLKRLPFQADRTMRNKINEGALTAYRFQIGRAHV